MSDTGKKAMALGALGALAGALGIIIGTEAPPDADKRSSISISWAKPPVGARCVELVGRYDPKCLLEWQDKTAAAPPAKTAIAASALPGAPVGSYGTVTACWDAANPIQVPQCFDVVEKRDVAYADKAPQTVIANGDDKPLACACAGAGACEALTVALDGKQAWAAAPKGTTFQPGAWRGACVPKACVETNQTVEELKAGGSSMPKECLK